ncbi:MAG: RidA family protein [Candidatus Limnocylindrales bacterium]
MASKQVIRSEGMPKAIGPYSHAVRAGDLLFVSGQPGVDPVTGEAPAEFTAQARQAFANLGTVLRAAGSGLEHVVKTTVFLTDATKFPELNALFAEVFPTDPPTRVTPVVALPRNLLISVECIAVMP